MAFNHAKNTVVKINAVDLSQYTNTAEMVDDTETHDVTCFGAVRKAYRAGLGDGTFTIGGVHDDGATSPRAVLKPLKTAGTITTFLYQPEGAGAGKAQSSVSVIVKQYTDTSAVNAMHMWKATLQMTGPLDETDQV